MEDFNKQKRPNSLDHSQVFELLENLGFINQENPLDMYKWDDLWEDICRLNNYKSEVTVQNLLFFMATIQNFTGFVSGDESCFKLSKTLGLNLHKKYLRLCQNRQDYLRTKRIASKKAQQSVMNESMSSPIIKK